MFKRLVITFFFTSLSVLVYCDNYRPAIVYLTSGDSLIGLVSYTERSENEKLIFKKAEGYLERVYDVLDVHSFLFTYTGRKFVRETILEQGLSKSVFVEEIVKSKISLYALNNDADTKFYLKKRGSSRLIDLPVTRLPETTYNGYAIKSYNSYTTNHKDTLRKYMNDAVEIDKYIDKIAFPERNLLISLMKDYNKQFGEESITAQQLKIKLISPEFSITPALYYSATAVNRQSNNFTLYYGGLLSFGANYSKHQLSVNSGLFMTTFNQVYSTEDLNTYKASLFKIPAYVKYQYDLKSIRPAIATGFNTYFSDPYGIKILSTIQVGADIYLSKHFSIKLMPEFEFNITNSTNPVRHQVFSVLLGISYRI